MSCILVVPFCSLCDVGGRVGSRYTVANLIEIMVGRRSSLRFSISHGHLFLMDPKRSGRDSIEIKVLVIH
jgi:hypothetical protein